MKKKYMHEIDDFIFPLTTKSVTRAALEETDKTTDDKDMKITLEASGVHQPQTTIYHPQPTSTTVDGQLTEQIDDTETVEDNDDIPVVLPTINARDYDTDEEFGDMYRYLQTEKLTGDERKDKTTLLLRDKFMIENNLLYRIDSPRQKRLACLKPVIERLCVPNVLDMK